MKRILAACSIATVIIGAAACDNTAPATHTKAKAGSGGIVTSMAFTQSFDDSRSCEHTPAQAECATVWTIAYRDQAGKQHTASVTETAYNRCLRRFPGGHYPACAAR